MTLKKRGSLVKQRVTAERRITDLKWICTAITGSTRSGGSWIGAALLLRGTYSLEVRLQAPARNKEAWVWKPDGGREMGPRSGR